MAPETARRILLALRNYRQPGRTIGARIRDAIEHARNSQKEAAAKKRGSMIHEWTGFDEQDKYKPPV